MYTFGYGFRPWGEHERARRRPGIRLRRDTAEESGSTDTSRFGRKVITADVVDREVAGPSRQYEATASRERYVPFLFGCTGYYNYDQGYQPEFAGEAEFEGQIIHPQHWPEDLDYTGKRVVVIGSGATAITLVPNMTDDAAHVTMLQRSPTYIMAVPAKDPLAVGLDGRRCRRSWSTAAAA